jgi:phenylalanyl-tRNA synthetase alpha chain
MDDIKRLIETLHPLERKALPHLNSCATLRELMQKSGLSEAEAMRVMQWLENKEVLKITAEAKETVTLDTNGIEYVNKGLPERRFLDAVKNSPVTINDLGEKAGLNKEEAGVCLGLLKSKAAITVENGKISITEQGRKALAKEWLEETFLKKLSAGAIETEKLGPEERFAFDIFKKRKEIIKTDIEKIKHYELTALGKTLSKQKMENLSAIDTLTSGMLKQGSWKNKPFRRYDVNINVPRIYRGKRHFVNQAIDYTKRIWLDMGFKEMKGPLLQTSFWNFDALFTAQDHPVRDMQDTFFIADPKKGKLPSEQIVDRVKKTHENGWTTGSTGWRYKWNPEEAMKNVLRPHTTVLSAKTISELKKTDLPAKFFSVDRVFRNETLDYSHLFEFHQVEGIVIDPNANFKHLIGYIKEFYTKMGYKAVRIRPAYFPYTEPSVEVDVLHPVHNKWIELGGAGIFRPEVVKPLLGEDIPVLAWGQGLERGISEYFKITDIRDIYRNDLKQMREMKEWMR